MSELPIEDVAGKHVGRRGTNQTSIHITLSDFERGELERMARGSLLAHRTVIRAKAILLLAASKTVSEVSRRACRERRIVRKWADRFVKKRLRGLDDKERSGRPAHFPPEVATHLVKLACELPDDTGRSLSLWTYAELARALERSGVVEKISPQSVQRVLESQQLRPWRVHHWLSPKVPRDEAFHQTVLAVQDLYTRPPLPNERVICLDEKTSIQPRPRTEPTKAACPLKPVLLESEYRHACVLNLLAAFDTRTGEVIALCRKRKRQAELIELLEEIDRTTPAAVTLIHLLCDNVRTHKAKLVCAWLADHPRFQMHFTPVHCSWMNQVEQWFSILSGARLE